MSARILKGSTGCDSDIGRALEGSLCNNLFIVAIIGFCSVNASQQHALKELPLSAKLVYKAPEWNGKLTQKGIVEEMMLSVRTIRYALNWLKKVDIVSEKLYTLNARQNVYSLCERELPSP